MAWSQILNLIASFLLCKVMVSSIVRTFELHEKRAIWTWLESPKDTTLRASSCELGQPGWLGFRDLASPLFPSLKFRCVHMRGRAGPVTEISVFATEISVTGMKIFPYEQSSPGNETFLTK